MQLKQFKFYFWHRNNSELEEHQKHLKAAKRLETSILYIKIWARMFHNICKRKKSKDPIEEQQNDKENDLE
jgi:hypothetical protein